jgi:hypothetical protein
VAAPYRWEIAVAGDGEPLDDMAGIETEGRTLQTAPTDQLHLLDILTTIQDRGHQIEYIVRH